MMGLNLSEAIEQDRPRRGRPPRAEAVAAGRRRRQPGTLNRLVQMKLDFIPESALDDSYVYRWVNDDPGRIRWITSQDDYDHVEINELGDGFDATLIEGAESDARIRMLVGTNEGGGPKYAYLMRKPKEFWQADYNEVMDAREAQMEGRVYQGAVGGDGPSDKAVDHAYVPAGNQIGHGGERRRGPVPSKLK